MLARVVAFSLDGIMLQATQHFAATSQPSLFTPCAVVLFQGDSITDGNRGRNTDPNHILGHGYAFIIAAKIGDERVEQNITFINRGISGNTVADLAQRWDTDAIALKPDFISILIGINDVMKGVTAEDFERKYDALLKRTRDSLPAVRLMLIEPFFLLVGNKFGDVDAFAKRMETFRAIVARLAAKYHARLVPAQSSFDKACDRAPAAHWIWDGVHPTYSGHQILANAWLDTVGESKTP